MAKLSKYIPFSMRLDKRTIKRLKKLNEEYKGSWNLLIVKLLDKYEDDN